MATSPEQGSTTGRIRLDGGDDLDERPELAVHALGEGKVLASAVVTADGTFELDADAVDRARRIAVTARDGDPLDRATAHVLRPAALARALEAGELALPAEVWGRFLVRRRCVDATLRRCFPWRFVLDDLATRIRTLPPVGSLTPPKASLLLPPLRCAPVCVGAVEVYRRRCCCIALELDPPVLEEVPDLHLPDPLDRPARPVPPIPPGPGPDPAPFALQDQLLTGGALDLAKVRRLQAHPGLRWPLCSCGAPVKVADGFVGEGGAIHVCWSEPLTVTRRGCHDELAFVVRQQVAGTTVVIYDGVAAGQWFDAGDEIRLTSYHPRAVGCREEDFPVPGTGAFVVLQDIGSTESHLLDTPMPDGPDSVHTPSAGSGLLDLDPGEGWALGGDLQLRYHFSEVPGHSMRDVGASYYRVQWAPADALGNPAGPWETVPVPAWSTWRVVGSEIVPGSHALGPVSVGGQHDLFAIPFETGGVLVADEEWQDGQFHAVVPTASRPEGRHLLRVEVFDVAGTRLEPATSAFTFLRWATATTTVPVAFGALTHLLHTDNRPVVAELVDVVGPGAGAGDCKFFQGAGGEAVGIQYRAFHPQPGSPSFLRRWTLSIIRGVSGTLATPVVASAVEVGEGGPPALHAVTIADLLDGEDRCSFAVRLDASARISNGRGALTSLDASDVAAFAVLLAPVP